MVVANKIVSAIFILYSLSCTANASAQEFPFKDCHIEVDAPQSVDASIDQIFYAPHTTAAQWWVIAPAPPTIPQQPSATSSLTFNDSQTTGAETPELSKEHRLVLTAKVLANQPSLIEQLHVHCRYQTTIQPKHLVTGHSDTVVKPLTPEEANAYLTATETIDFATPTIANWLQNNNLVRKPDERDLDYAWRLFNFMKQTYSYKYIADQNRQASNLCNAESSDSAGLSYLLVAALRANHIPARALIGRWLQSDTVPNDDVKSYHVKSEFYADGIGWVPVDISQALETKPDNPTRFFGEFAGDFLTLHIDPDLVFDTIWFGKKSFPAMQSPLVWVTGAGSMDQATSLTLWQVSKPAIKN